MSLDRVTIEVRHSNSFTHEPLWVVTHTAWPPTQTFPGLRHAFLPWRVGGTRAWMGGHVAGGIGWCFLVLRWLLLVRFCVVVWVFFSVFSVCCITSFGDCARPQHQETTTAEPREDSEQVKLKSTYFPRRFLSKIKTYRIRLYLKLSKLYQSEIFHCFFFSANIVLHQEPITSWLHLTIRVGSEAKNV